MKSNIYWQISRVYQDFCGLTFLIFCHAFRGHITFQVVVVTLAQWYWAFQSSVLLSKCIPNSRSGGCEDLSLADRTTRCFSPIFLYFITSIPGNNFHFNHFRVHIQHCIVLISWQCISIHVIIFISEDVYFSETRSYGKEWNLRVSSLFSLSFLFSEIKYWHFIFQSPLVTWHEKIWELNTPLPVYSNLPNRFLIM